MWAHCSHCLRVCAMIVTFPNYLGRLRWEGGCKYFSMTHLSPSWPRPFHRPLYERRAKLRRRCMRACVTGRYFHLCAHSQYGTKYATKILHPHSFMLSATAIISPAIFTHFPPQNSRADCCKNPVHLPTCLLRYSSSAIFDHIPAHSKKGNNNRQTN